jgi:Uma2 family endonuclease
MTVAEAPKLMTTEELLALPDDGVERWLIRGQLREKPATSPAQSRGKPMTIRNRTHSRIMIRVGHVLESWSERQPEPRGSVLCGEVGVRLRRTPDSTVGVDVIYISPQTAAQQSAETTLIDGAPVLAVEILSANDTHEEINEKIDDYLQSGVLLVWIIDSWRQTVQVFRPNEEPQMVNIRQELSGEPHLPGFRVPVAQLFV